MHWLENWILPPRCVITGEPGTELDLSPMVIQSLKIPKQVCPQCCEFSADNQLCGACLVNPPAYDLTQVAYYFEGHLSELIHALKYANQVAYARLLAELLLPTLKSNQIDALIAVPIHQQRWRKRGFNQSYLIAAQLSKVLGVPLLKDAVLRVKDTPSQTGLTRKQRELNLKRAFKVDTNQLIGVQRLAIVDDVITTGATIKAMAELIKKQTDVNYIEAWAIAKTQ